MHRQPGAGGAVVLVVHGDDRPSGRVEEGCGDARAISRTAMHPRLAGGHVGEARRQLVKGDVDGAGDVRGVPFLVAAHVHDHHRAVTPCRRQVGEVRDGIAAQRLAVGPVGRRARGGRGRAVDADPDQFTLGLGDLLGGLAEQGQRRAQGISQPR